MHYQAGRYSVAVALLEEAYALHAEPKLLYNLGRAREANGDARGAVEAYEAFLESEPDGERRTEVQGRVEQLRAEIPPDTPKLTPDSHVQPPTTPHPEPPDPVRATSHGAEDRAGELRRTVPWILLGSGGGLLAGALTLGIMARSQQRQATNEPVQTEAVKLQNTAERRALIANLLAGAGGALVVAGGAWLVFGGRRGTVSAGSRASERAWSVRLRPTGIDYVLAY